MTIVRAAGRLGGGLIVVGVMTICFSFLLIPIVHTHNASVYERHRQAYGELVDKGMLIEADSVIEFTKGNSVPAFLLASLPEGNSIFVMIHVIVMIQGTVVIAFGVVLLRRKEV